MLSILTLLALSSSTPAEAPPAHPLSLISELPADAPDWSFQEGVKEQEEWESLFSYTYIEVGASRFDIDTFEEAGDEADIYYGKASLGLFRYFYIFGGYENQAADFEDTSTDLIKLGVGGHYPIGSRVDLVGDVAWLWSDIDSDLSELDDTNTGAEFHLGGRWMPIDWDGGGLEVHAGGVYIDLKDRLASDDEALGWDAGLKVHFLRMLSVGAVYTRLEDDDSAGVNARVSF
jgi:hypothetical protein